MDNRFRKARTNQNWMECDGIKIGDQWHYFKDGDEVEFKVDGKLYRRKIMVKHGYTTALGIGYVERLSVSHAFVSCPRKRTRITDAPPVRLVGGK